MSAPVHISSLAVSPTFCHSDWPTTVAYIVSLLQATLEGDIQTINFGSTTPAAEARDKPRFLINADGTPAYSSWASYSNGNWLARHPLAPGIIVMYEGTEASITTLDGGETATVSTTTGPFWERVTQMDARFPIGPGTLASGTVVSVGTTGGAETVTLTLEQIPSHVHTIKIGGATQATGGNVIESAETPDAPQGSKDTLRTGGDENHETVAHTNLPPYRGIWFIRRTGRLFFRQ